MNFEQQADVAHIAAHVVLVVAFIWVWRLSAKVKRLKEASDRYGRYIYEHFICREIAIERLCGALGHDWAKPGQSVKTRRIRGYGHDADEIYDGYDPASPTQVRCNGCGMLREATKEELDGS